MIAPAISNLPHVRALLDRLERVRATGVDQATASCPGPRHARGDRNPSLSVAVADDGKILLNCHVGCTAGEIVAALGLEMVDLYPPRSQTWAGGRGRVPGGERAARRGGKAHPTLERAVGAVRWGIATSKQIDQAAVRPNGQWTYEDASGVEVMRVLRFDLPGGRKEYRPIHPVPAGGYAVGDPPGKLPLYNLRGVLPAARVYLFEGEKCADAARGIGLSASTTTAHGARSFDKTDVSPLAGREVVIVGDADQAGRDYVRQATAALLALDPPARVKVVELPGLGGGEDVVEFIEYRRQSGVEADDEGFIRDEVERLADACPFEPPTARPGPMTFRELAARHPSLREAVVTGLLRVGETANVIAASKVGKSWLVLDLALAVATGRAWLGTFATAAPRDVLIVDNELHPETIAKRIPEVARARGVPLDDYADRLHVHTLRGKLRDLHGLREFFDGLEPGRYGLVILDAWYRLLPADTDENDNGAIARLYNELDNIADRLGCAFAVIHHASKGAQGGKAVTDVGAGAGSQARAVDTHLVLRQHEEDGVVVLDAATRSWAPVTPLCLKWQFPIWQPAADLDPTRLRMERNRGGRPRGLKEDIEAAAAATKPVWTLDTFVARFVGSEPKTAAEILCEADQEVLSGRQAKQFLEAAEAKGLIHRWRRGKRQPDQYATRPATVFDAAGGR